MERVTGTMAGQENVGVQPQGPGRIPGTVTRSLCSNPFKYGRNDEQLSRQFPVPSLSTVPIPPLFLSLPPLPPPPVIGADQRQTSRQRAGPSTAAVSVGCRSSVRVLPLALGSDGLTYRGVAGKYFVYRYRYL